jgi:hypothetical protein
MSDEDPSGPKVAEPKDRWRDWLPEMPAYPSNGQWLLISVLTLALAGYSLFGSATDTYTIVALAFAFATGGPMGNIVGDMLLRMAGVQTND